MFECISQLCAVNLAEWSKAPRSGRGLFGGVGSNPTVDIFVRSPNLENGLKSHIEGEISITELIGAMAARLTPDQKVACSSHVWVTFAPLICCK